jgi:hypothetical protein
MASVAFLFGFEARSIQDWITMPGRLRHVTNGSEILERLCREDIARALKACGFEGSTTHDAGAAHLFRIGDSVVFDGVRPITLAAGRIELAIAGEHREKGERLLRLWPLMVGERAPLLRFAVAGMAYDPGGFGAALAKLRQELREAAARPVFDPYPAGPLLLRAQRTGLPAVSAAFENPGEDPDEEPEAQDVSMVRRCAEEHLSRTKGYRLLDRKLDPDGSVLHAVDEAEELTKGRPNRYVAMLHADGTGIGAALMRVNDRLAGAALDDDTRIEAQRRLSQLIDETGQAAARDALAAVAGGGTAKLRLRPIVLGGDDLTMLMPAVLGWPFACDFARAFERRSAEGIARFHDWLRSRGMVLDGALPDRFTCGVGIAFVQALYPYSVAAKLADDLCRSAKRGVAGKGVSAVAFHRVTASAAEGWDEIEKRELTAGHGAAARRLTMVPYVPLADGATVTAGMRSTGQLDRLVDALRQLPRGAVADLASLIHEPEAGKAEARFQRVVEMAKRRQDGGATALKTALEALGCKDSPWSRVEGGPPIATPLGDAAALLALAREVPHDGSPATAPASGAAAGGEAAR